MTKKNLVLSMALCFAFAPSSLMFAQQPVQNIDPQRHPVLASAQSSIARAYQKIESAQQNNQDRLGGHAERAKQLLAEASHELKEAARYANHHR